MLKPSAMLLCNLTFLAIVLSIVTSKEMSVTQSDSADQLGSSNLTVPNILDEVKSKINYTISTVGSNIARVKKEIECLKSMQNDIKILLGNVKNHTKSLGDIKTLKKIEMCMIRRQT